MRCPVHGIWNRRLAYVITIAAGVAFLSTSGSGTTDSKTVLEETIRSILNAAQQQQSQSTTVVEDKEIDLLNTVPNIPDEPWQVGIFDGAEAPFPSMDYLFTNAYQGIYDTQDYVQVFAGALGEDLNQGVAVMLFTARNRLDSRAESPFVTPTATGALRVMAAALDEVVLKSTGGDYYTLNIRTKRLTVGRPLWYQDP